MKLLNKNQKKKITTQEKNTLRKAINNQIDQKNLKFIYRNPLLWKILIFAISALSIIGGAIFVVFDIIEKGTFQLSETDEIILGIVVFGAIGISSFAYREWQKRNRNQTKAKFAHFKKIRIKAFTNWFNQTYDDAQITQYLNKNVVKKYVQQLRASSDWLKVPKIHEIHPGYQIMTKNNVSIDCFIVTILETQKDKIIRRNFFNAIIKNQTQKWANFKFVIKKGLKNSGKLENQQFNKKWGYQSNDKVKLRMLLTPWTQEELTKSETNFALIKNDQLTYWWGEEHFKNNLFETKVEVGKTREQTVNIIVEDIIEDFKNLEFLIKELAVYKALIF